MAGVTARILRALYRKLAPTSVKDIIRAQLLLSEHNRDPQLIRELKKGRVLVLAPHMDDDVFGCGGTIRHHVLSGSCVTIVYLTDGRTGHGPFPPGSTRAGIKAAEDALVEQRKREAICALEILGIQRSMFMDCPEGKLLGNRDWADQLKHIIDDSNPDVIYLPSLMDDHEDHWHANCLFYQAACNLPDRRRREIYCRGYEIWTPLYANQYIDISNVIEIKMQAMRQFESQLDRLDFVRTTRALNAYRSMKFLAGKGHAEAFYGCALDEYCMLFNKLIGLRHPKSSKR
jgi:N-acetylglucosamine malate deacetylase 1